MNTMQLRHSLKYIVSPILCSSFCSTQLLEQFLVAFIQRQHTATDRNTVNHIPVKKNGPPGCANKELLQGATGARVKSNLLIELL